MLKIVDEGDLEGEILMDGNKKVGICLNIKIGDTLIILTFSFKKFGDYTGRGYGPKFYKLLEERSRRRGIKKIILDDVEIDAIDFWKKMGFKDTGERRDDVYPIMEKIIK